MDNLLCKEHGCPLINIAKKDPPVYMCVFEYLDEMIGNRQITHFRVNKGVSVVLDCEIVLPLICPHCSNDSICIDVKKAELYVNLYIVALSFNEDYTTFFMHMGNEDGEPIEEAVIPTKLESIFNIIELK